MYDTIVGWFDSNLSTVGVAITPKLQNSGQNTGSATKFMYMSPK